MNVHKNSFEIVHFICSVSKASITTLDKKKASTGISKTSITLLNSFIISDHVSEIHRHFMNNSDQTIFDSGFVVEVQHLKRFVFIYKGHFFICHIFTCLKLKFFIKYVKTLIPCLQDFISSTQ